MSVDAPVIPAPARSAGTRVVLAPPLRVAVVGLGYVGLPTAIAHAQDGGCVTGVDTSAARIAAVRALRVDLLPSDLEALADVLDDRLRLTTDPAGVADADAVVICVPTPVDEHLVPDLRALSAACRDVVAHARPGQTVVLTSTTYVGATRDLLVEPLARRGLRVGHDVFVAFSPERIDPANDRYRHRDVPRVVGGATPECLRRARAVLEQGTDRVHPVSSPEAAELTKLFENTFRAVNIALVNELAAAVAALPVEVVEVIDAAATKPYGFMPFTPGPGVGGHCIPCDPHYLLWQLRRDRVEMPLVEQAMRDIAARPAHVVARCREVLGDRGLPVAGARVVVLGVAYKPGVEDVRESPAVEILSRLRRLGADVAFVDPLVQRVRLADGSELSASSEREVEEGSPDLVLVHTRQPGMDLARLAGAARVVDATYRAVELPRRVVV